jgi:hypothetical protein
MLAMLAVLNPLLQEITLYDEWKFDQINGTDLPVPLAFIY